MTLLASLFFPTASLINMYVYMYKCVLLLTQDVMLTLQVRRAKQFQLSLEKDSACRYTVGLPDNIRLLNSI